MIAISCKIAKDKTTLKTFLSSLFYEKKCSFFSKTIKDQNDITTVKILSTVFGIFPPPSAPVYGPNINFNLIGARHNVRLIIHDQHLIDLTS